MEQQHGLGRLYAPDERDKRFPLAAIMADVPTPNSRYWRLGEILDQGSAPACVGFSGRQWLSMSPVRYWQPQPDGSACYHGAQQFDEWSGENYDGSSARGLMKFLQSLGLVDSYYWESDVETAAQYVLTTGPVLVGANFHEDMFHPDSKGFVKPTGRVVGGHEWVWYGYNQKLWTCSFANSWGTAWGIKGRFKMKRDQFEALMAESADMCAAVESKIV